MGVGQLECEPDHSSSPSDKECEDMYLHSPIHLQSMVINQAKG